MVVLPHYLLRIEFCYTVGIELLFLHWELSKFPDPLNYTLNHLLLAVHFVLFFLE